MSIVAFDLSLSNTGVAIFDDAGTFIRCLSIDTKKEKTHPLKLKKIEKELKKIKKDYKPKKIIVEESFTRFNKSTQAIYKCRGVLELLFYNTEQIFYHATSVRKRIMGKGNVKKKDVQEFIVNKYSDIPFADLDQSDAFAVGLCYFMEQGVIDG